MRPEIDKLLDFKSYHNHNLYLSQLPDLQKCQRRNCYLVQLLEMKQLIYYRVLHLQFLAQQKMSFKTIRMKSTKIKLIKMKTKINSRLNQKKCKHLELDHRLPRLHKKQINLQNHTKRKKLCKHKKIHHTIRKTNSVLLEVHKIQAWIVATPILIWKTNHFLI